MLPKVIDIHFNTRLQHDIQHSDLAQSLNGVTAFYQVQRIGTDDDTDHDKTHNTRNADLAAYHRYEQNSAQ